MGNSKAPAADVNIGLCICWRHTVPILTADGNTIKEIFKIGSDRVCIGYDRAIRDSIFSHRMNLSGFGSNFVIGRKIFGMPKNCRRYSRRFIFVLTSCVHFALRKTIERASYQIVSSSFLLRVIIGTISQFRLTTTTRRKQEAARLA